VLVSGTGPRKGNWVVCNEDVSLRRIVVSVWMVYHVDSQSSPSKEMSKLTLLRSITSP